MLTLMILLLLLLTLEAEGGHTAMQGRAPVGLVLGAIKTRNKKKTGARST